MDNQQLNRHTLFLACTRPAMMLGVPTVAMILNCLMTMIIFIISKNFAYLLLCVPVHYIFRAIVRKDVNQFNILFLWLQTKARGMNKSFWAGTTISPLIIKRKKLTWEEYRAFNKN